VLITTSVTEEGFDIPECKMVVSFDKPSSLKSYIQIKGRARERNSRYIIFATEGTEQKMKAQLECYDDIIKLTTEIAINKFSDKSPQERIRPRAEVGYERMVLDSGALLNTSYSLEVLKIYCATLHQPNKLIPIYIETPNVAYRCVLHFPETSPTSKPYIIGKASPNKVEALKSAAFEAVKYLHKEKYIRGDLRPKKYE
jgi:endoribonuclease Dicer